LVGQVKNETAQGLRRWAFHLFQMATTGVMRNSPARLSLIQGNSLVALGSAVTCCCINQIETNIYISETIIAEIFSR
jgi:hypothetical protein